MKLLPPIMGALAALCLSLGPTVAAQVPYDPAAPSLPGQAQVAVVVTPPTPGVATGATRVIVMGAALPNQTVTAGSGNTKTRFKGRRCFRVGSDADTIVVPWANAYISNTAPNEFAGPGDLTIEKVSVETNGVTAPVTYGGVRAATVAASATSQVYSDAMPVSAWGLTKLAKASTACVRWIADMTTAGGVASTAFGNAAEQLYRFAPGTSADDDVDATGAMSAPSGADAANVPGPVGIFGRVFQGSTNLDPAAMVVAGDSIADNTNDFSGDGAAGTGVSAAGTGGGWISRVAYQAGVPFLKMTLGGHKAANYGNSTHTWRDLWWKSGTIALDELGINDTANILVYNRAIWTAAYTAGVTTILQATLTPKTANDSSASPWNVNTTLAGEAAITTPDYLAANVSMRGDVGGAYHLTGVLDVETAIGDAANRRNYALPVGQLSTTLATATTATSTSTIFLSAPASTGMLLTIGAGASGVQVVKVNGPSTGTGPYATPIVTQVLASGAAVGTAVVETNSADGTHPGPRPHGLIAATLLAQVQALATARQ